MVSSNITKTNRYHTGQALILALGLALVASVSIFLVFNSGRAVNEKINLVNAADAAAYSGAQIAARQLNFMAYTNRAMIANEVSVGHVFSYQMELELVNELAEQMLSGSTNPLFDILIWIADLFVQGDLRSLITGSMNTLGQVFALFGDLSHGISGAYAISVDANNAFYSSLQQEAFRDFAYPAEGRPLVDVAMQAVARDYELRPSSPILINDEDTLNYFMSNGTPEIQAAATQAASMHQAFCQMVLFVSPTGAGTGSVGVGNQMRAFCDAIAAGGSPGNAVGSAENPTGDEGSMLEMLRTTVSNFSNAEWIRDRNSNYYLAPLFPARREGSTTVVYENGQLNWKSSDDSLRVSAGAIGFSLPLTTVNASGDAAQMSVDAAGYLNGAVIGLLEQYEMCGAGTSIDCDALAGGGYKGVQRYTYLNPDYARPRVTAFLAQQKCGDHIGVDDEGNQIEGWHNNLSYLERDRPICEGNVYAVAQAEVFFQRPTCEANAADCSFGFSQRDQDNRNFSEQPNLFNPFWQVKLVSSAGG